MGTWHTPETIRDEWEDAEQIGDDLLAQLVTAARDAVMTYAPALPLPADGAEQSIPDRYRVAQLMQVRNLWSAVDVKPSGEIGGETFTYQPRPLDWHVKALLRPQRGRPRVG
ncbi:hypothetical protein ACYX8G_14620 [Microbacterium saperdae]